MITYIECPNCHVQYRLEKWKIVEVQPITCSNCSTQYDQKGNLAVTLDWIKFNKHTLNEGLYAQKETPEKYFGGAGV